MRRRLLCCSKYSAPSRPPQECPSLPRQPCAARPRSRPAVLFLNRSDLCHFTYSVAATAEPESETRIILLPRFWLAIGARGPAALRRAPRSSSTGFSMAQAMRLSSA
ncbi:hypothetical protein CHELA20_52663 [Hyphomicrobiales bacterium]|nr:hypothetical protein CHELA41_22265 [Hyphomicrobiales bacterium]CAH1682547.1 hypothetical protein CHELA20_52663 [Hyphomicrobiales bacterium]